MRKILQKRAIFLLAALFFIFQFAGPAAGDVPHEAYFSDTSDVRIDQIAVNVGEEITVRVYTEVPDGKSLDQFSVTVNYDASKVSLVNAEVPEASPFSDDWTLFPNYSGIAGQVILGGFTFSAAVVGPTAVIAMDITFSGDVEGGFDLTITFDSFGTTTEEFPPTPDDLAVCVGIPTLYYPDADDDGYGDSGNGGTLFCDDPGDGWSINNADCNDGAAAINPDADETCDGVDNDCDGNADDDDDDVTDPATWYEDADSDTYGNVGSTMQACEQPTGYVADSTDCNDGNVDQHPNATEICNGIDDDCDLLIDDADDGITGQLTWYADTDVDGFGDPNTSMLECDQPNGYVADNTDCVDTNGNIYPGADEICNDIDDDCDTLVDDADDGITDQSTWYADTDDDGYGDPGASMLACDQPDDYVNNDDDCDDSAIGVNPDADEICNGIDDDCDNLIDDADGDITGQATWYADTDSDTFGDPNTSMLACDQPADYVADNTDCDDTSNVIYPGAPEICDEEDNDCNGTVDDIGDVDSDGENDCEDNCPAVASTLR